MVIHSIAPLQMLLPEAPVSPCEIPRFEGGFLRAARIHGRLRITGSPTDPNLYLDPKLSPAANRQPSPGAKRNGTRLQMLHN
jgi:hypothetical protein